MHKLLGVVVGVALFAPLFALASVDLTLNGGSVTVRQGAAYNEPGFTANSTVDGNITNLVSVSNPGTGSSGTFSVNYAVTDSALDSAFASRTLIVQSSDSLMPFCSGPMAPGWHVGVAGGGCGGTQVFVPAGTGACPFWFTGGCILPR